MSKKASHDKAASNGRKFGILMGKDSKSDLEEPNPMVNAVLSEIIQKGSPELLLRENGYFHSVFKVHKKGHDGIRKKGRKEIGRHKRKRRQ